MHELINRHPFLAFISCTILLPVLLNLLVGCGEPPADPDPTSDGGTTDTDTGKPDNDAGVEDAGVADSGDKPDAGKDPCAENRACIEKLHNCLANTGVHFTTDCQMLKDTKGCYAKCSDMGEYDVPGPQAVIGTDCSKVTFSNSTGWSADCTE